MIYWLARREFLRAVSSVAVGRYSMRTAAQADPTTHDVLRFDKRIRVTDAIWLYALGDDGRFVAYISCDNMDVFVVDIDAGTTTKMLTPQLNAKSIIAWHPDGEHFAVFNALQCQIISVKESRCVREIANPEPARFYNSALFSRDGRKLYVESSNTDAVITELDLATLQTRDLHLPDTGAKIRFVDSKSGCFQRGRADIFSGPASYSTGEKNSGGMNIMRTFGFSLDLTRADATPTFFPIDVGNAAQDGPTGLRLFSKFLYSEPTDSYVFYWPPYNATIDSSTYVALHTFKADGTKLSSFADFDVLRQRCKKGIAVHPQQPWVITTISSPEPDPFGEIIVWDLRNGQIVQKLTSGLSAFNPLLSVDGRTMIVTDPHIAVLRFH